MRFATIDAGYAVYQAHATAPKPARDAALVAFFLAQPAVEAAGVSEANNLWVRFTDGTLFFLLDNGGDPPVTPGIGPQALTAGPSPFVNDLPGGVTAVSATSLETGWTNVSGEIGGWLTNSGYTVKTGALRVSDFEALSNVSVLFWQTHSGEGALRQDAGTPQADGGPPMEFAYLTSTIATVALGKALLYSSLRDQGYLAYGSIPLNAAGTAHEDRYAITGKYIRDRLKGKFAPAALVAIDSCTAAAADADWAAAGVAQFAGWSSPSGTLSAVAFERYFDRLLGQNTAPPLSAPKERPFMSSKVTSWLQAFGYDLDRSLFKGGVASTAQLLFFHHPANGDFAILRPTITRVLNTASSGATSYRWTIEGTFGEDPGPGLRSVSYGGVDLDVLSWAADSISVKVPKPPPSGDFVVTVGTRKSEPVPMTEWLIPFTYTLHGHQSLTFVATVNCRLRADVRGNRFQPGDSPSFILAPSQALSDRSGTVTASGQELSPSNQLLEQWSGGSTLTAFDPAVASPRNYVICQGVFNAPASALQTFVVTAAGEYTTLHGLGGAAFYGIAAPMTLGMDWQTLRINGSTLTADSRQIPGVSATLQWPSVLPTNAPTDNDAR